MSTSKTFLLSVLLGQLALTPLAWSQAPSLAEPAGSPVPGAPADTSSNGLEEITVTARRREENSQTVPVSITSFSAAELTDRTVTQESDLGTITPSLIFRQSNYTQFGSYVGIRGQMTTDTIITQSPAIGSYVDDVYMPTTNNTGSSGLVDVGAIEVLKGPQGTLYGRNTTGGAIKITTQLPNYDGISGAVKLGGGNLGSNVESAEINLPLVDQKAALRINIGRDYTGDYGTGHFPDGSTHEIGDKDTKTFRVALRLDPTEDLEVMLRGDYADNRSDGVVSNLAAITPPFNPSGTPTFSSALLNVGVAKGYISLADLASLSAATPSAAAIGRVVAGTVEAYNFLRPFLYTGTNVTQEGPIGTGIRDGGGSLTASYKINDDLTVKSITAYRYENQATLQDVFPNPVLTLYGQADVDRVNQYTEELQLAGKAIDSKLLYTIGYFFYRLSAQDATNGEYELPYINPDTPQYSYAYYRDVSNAIYGQDTYSLLDVLHLTTGIRWTDEGEHLGIYDHEGPNAFLGGTNLPCALPPPAAVGSCLDSYENKFHNVSYTASLDWDITSNILTYVKTSRGFKAGGTNQRGGATGGFNNYAPEIVTDYEVGAKSEWLDHRLRVNVALYHSNYKDIQRTADIEIGEQTISEINNASSAKIDGVELEIAAKPIAELTLHLTGAFTDARYNTFVEDGVNESGQPFESTPRWEGDAAATYEKPVQFGSFTTTIDYSYQSQTNLDPEDGSLFTNGFTTQPGYGLLNGRISTNIRAFDLDVALWGRNIADKHYHTAALDLLGTPTGAASLGLGYVYLPPPRTVGLEVVKRF